MNLHQHILALSLFALVHSSLSHKTADELTPSSNSIHPRHSIRGLGGSSADFSDNSHSNDDPPEQMTRTATSITDADRDTDEEDVSVNVVDYLSTPNALESLANLINNRLIVSDVYGSDTDTEDEEQDRLADTMNELDYEPVDLVSFFGVTDAKAFPVFSYSYDTMPPTISRQTESPALISDTSIASTESEEPTDDLLIINESTESPPRVPTPAPIPSATTPPNDRNDEEVLHSPSFHPSVFTHLVADAIETVCFPPCKESEEICRSSGKGGSGSCHPKCKSKNRCDYGDVCRSDGYCDRCRACKNFRKKECCSVDLGMCREIIPGKKVDECFKKCSYDEDCSALISPNPLDVCLLDGGCSRTKSEKKKNYKKTQKYYTVGKETEYVAKGDKYQKNGIDKYNDKGSRMLAGDDPDADDKPATRRSVQKGAPRSHRTMQRRRLYSHDMNA